ncbi:hypothetical protein SASPL_135193 [Salvia splendens]|uniref:Tf2-1-like SH3-like domain-containing protein n=1 Tax=Salvia splendens TaxID=180675 RepID=A0A8X8WZM4_SALSN|nr:hypothetical protein SASPL_135193 [Salvia splendens]
MTPFEAVYGRPPPTLHAFLPGEIRAQSVLDTLRSRDEILKLLRLHLGRAQDRMMSAANKRRRDIEFSVGDMVYLKFRPHRQSSLFSGRNRKLAPRFFGPFRIEARIGTRAYRLKLPDDARIHPVFHVSLLKRAIGDAPVEATLPDSLVDATPPFLPDKVLARRTEHRDNATVDQVLIGWVGLGDDEATWMDETDDGKYTHAAKRGKRLEAARKKGKPAQGFEDVEEVSLANLQQFNRCPTFMQLLDLCFLVEYD